MLFNSISYILFLFVFVSLYWSVPVRWRIPVVVVGSSLFYCLWSVAFFLLLLSTEIVIFACSRCIAASEGRSRKAWLVVSLGVNLGLLCFFKYFYFGYDGLRELLGLLGLSLPDSAFWPFRIILPLGISFHTFHSISYTVDIYRRVQKPLKSFLAFFAFIIFWPQLVAGPILRCGEVVPQLLHPREFEGRGFAYGVSRIVQGLFKKIVLADSLAPLVEYWFDKPHAQLTALDDWVAAFLFGFQIYFDFSGYSDIALGSAKLLGITFPENFNWPYHAVSPKDFWRRWHISLSPWIRDYLYLPLTGQHFQKRSEGGMAVAAGDASRPGRTRALLLAWALMGLWHGAAWTFVLWGVFHGFMVLLYRLVPPLASLPERHPWPARALMLAIAMFGWIPFRAHSLEQAFHMWGLALNPLAYRLSPDVLGLTSLTVAYSYLFAATFAGVLPLVYVIERYRDAVNAIPMAHFAARALAMAVMTFCVILFFQASQQFIYFQF